MVFGGKILLAADGSPESVRAARVATGLSEKFGLPLHVTYVAPVDLHRMSEAAIYAPDTGDHLRETFGRHARERVDEEAAKVREAGGEVAGTHPTFGRPDAEIVRLAEELGAGLIVLGSRGLGPLRRAVMGGVSLSVVRHAHCPVLVVRGERDDPLPAKILLALDGSEESRAAARASAELAARAGSKLHLVHVLQPEPLPFPHYYAADKYEADLKKVEEASRSFLEKEAKGMEDGGVAVAGLHPRTGNADHEIVTLAEELGAGLVVLGSRGLGGVRRALLGSVSDSVVRHAHCPVLVVRGETHE